MVRPIVKPVLLNIGLDTCSIQENRKLFFHIFSLVLPKIRPGRIFELYLLFLSHCLGAKIIYIKLLVLTAPWRRYILFEPILLLFLILIIVSSFICISDYKSE